MHIGLWPLGVPRLEPELIEMEDAMAWSLSSLCMSGNSIVKFPVHFMGLDIRPEWVTIISSTSSPMVGGGVNHHWYRVYDGGKEWELNGLKDLGSGKVSNQQKCSCQDKALFNFWFIEQTALSEWETDLFSSKQEFQLNSIQTSVHEVLAGTLSWRHCWCIVPMLVPVCYQFCGTVWLMGVQQEEHKASPLTFWSQRKRSSWSLQAPSKTKLSTCIQLLECSTYGLLT